MEKSVKNIIMGVIRALRWGLTSMLIPYLTFSYFKEYEALGGIVIAMPPVVYERVIFWITAIGLVTIAVAFGVGSSPKESVRRAVFGILLTSTKLFYLWMYKFSGAVDFAFVIAGLGSVSVDIGFMLRLWLGTIFLRYLIDIYDFVDAILYNSKQKKKRLEKGESIEGQQDFAKKIDKKSKENEELERQKAEFSLDMEV